MNESMLDVAIGPGMLDPEGAVLGLRRYHGVRYQRVACGGCETAGGLQCSGVVLQVHALPRGNETDAGPAGRCAEG